ncbi:MAG: hypothetical protein IT580_17380 [Verrucomicrobiales bacterium]|nr:hypothetical protein [Verrucomicrobiales bacterium]
MRSRPSPLLCLCAQAHSFRLLAAVVLLASPASVNAVDPDLPFTSGSTGADGPLTFREIPLGRTAPAMAYDPVRQEVVMFGGYNAGVGLGDTYVWRGTNWIRLQPTSNPPDRWSARMVWDATRQEVVLFGGTRTTGRLNDTWTWNGTNWTEKTPAASPSPRDGHCMAYDAARQEVVLFSGNGGAAETWVWNGANWTQRTPSTSPPATGSSDMVYHSTRQECVMFGNYGQTWVWNGTIWTQRNPLVSPAARNFPTLIQDGTSNTILLVSGNNRTDTWTWNGTNWTDLTPGLTTPIVPGRQYHSMVWDAARQRGVLFGGDVPSIDSYAADTWLWDGTRWQLWSDKTQMFDMAGRADGTWNFTTIHVPAGVTVRFAKNAGNTPVRWLATGDVRIEGVIDVSGVAGVTTLPPGIPAAGGPGGFDGGRGAIPVNSSGSAAGSPGQGPGGGAPGTAPSTSPNNLRDGNAGSFAGPTSTYGNAFLQPLTGGSGGGGGSSTDTGEGGHGGGGGGALMISTSRDLVLNGTVRANGGDRVWSNYSYGGTGSGGAILLRADRISGAGTLQAFGGGANNPNGRIRVEAYARGLTGSRTPAEVVGLPAANGELNALGTLAIVSVDGVNVATPPSGNLQAPDVVFTDAGPVQILVRGTGIPNGTAIRLRITTATSVIDATPQDLVNGLATFNVTVPKGLGTLQATAQFNAP